MVMSRTKLLDRITESIARMEGFYTKGTIAYRNNNPGNLRAWQGFPSVNGFAMFSSAEVGWDKLRKQTSRLIDKGLTLEEFFGGKEGVYPGYAPGSDGNRPKQYAAYVAQRVGISPNKVLKEVIQS